MGPGRPLKFQSSEEFEEAIQNYFDSITRTYPLYDNKIVGYEDVAKKKPIFEKVPRLNNAGEQVYGTEYFEIPTITGICLHIGISRDTWKDYESKEQFVDSITRAKQIVEKYNIEQLYRKEQVNGVIFNLKNNFGWKDKQEVETTGDQNINVNFNIPRPKEK